MSVTQVELAKRLKLSQQAVSHAFNRPHMVSEATRQRILDMASELGYRPNGAARAMLKKRFNAIALVQDMNGYRSNFEIPLMRGLISGADRESLSFSVASASDQVEALPRLLVENNVDGLLLNYHSQLPPHMADTLNGVPHVFINRKDQPNSVFPDEYVAGYGLAQHFIDHGYTTIYFIDANYFNFLSPERHYSREDHFSGYSDALVAKGISLKPLMDDGTVDSFKPADLARRIASETKGERCAVICQTEMIASGILAVAPLIPELANGQMQLGTFMANHQANQAPENMTIVEQDWYTIADESLRMLQARIEEPSTVLETIGVKPRFKLPSNLT